MGILNVTKRIKTLELLENIKAFLIESSCIRLPVSSQTPRGWLERLGLVLRRCSRSSMLGQAAEKISRQKEKDTSDLMITEWKWKTQILSHLPLYVAKGNLCPSSETSEQKLCRVLPLVWAQPVPF